MGTRGKLCCVLPGRCKGSNFQTYQSSVLSHTIPQILILEDIEGRKLGRIHALQTEDLYRCP